MSASKRQQVAPVASMSWRQVMAWRVHQHHLHQLAPRGSMVDLVAQLGRVQAQLMSSAELALWARIDRLQQQDVAQALWQERALVKTWAMWGTLHLLPASELRL